MLTASGSGLPSRVFGRRYPYPLDGRILMREVAEAFAREFNEKARARLVQDFGPERLTGWQDLRVTTAYPTTQKHCPLIAVQRKSKNSRISGVGGEVETLKVDGQGYRVFKGQMVTDTIDISICTMNEPLVEDLSTWFDQYAFDAVTWLLPQLPTVYDFKVINGFDDTPEYLGTNSQPGFQFYAAVSTFQVGYEQIVMEDVDALERIFNWQAIAYANLPGIVQQVTFVADDQ